MQRFWFAMLALLVGLAVPVAPAAAAEGVQLVASSKSAVAQGSRLRASPGFQLQMLPNNQILAKPRQGTGGLGADTWTCKCSKAGQGSCDGTSSGDVAVCSKNPSSPCLGNCEWDVNVGSGGASVGGGGMLAP